MVHFCKKIICWESVPGQLELQFYFQNIELSRLAPEELLQFGYPALLPLLLLTKGSARRDVVDRVFSGLLESGKKDLLPVGQSLASLAFGRNSTADQDWLVRRYREMFDVLRETPIYQEMTRTAREEGLEEGRQEGRQEALQRTLLNVVRLRFPKLERLARGQASIIDDPGELDDLIAKLIIAQNAKEAKRALIGDDEDEE